MSSYEIAVIFWGMVGALGLVLAVLGGILDATWRAARRRTRNAAMPETAGHDWRSTLSSAA
jgi:hypothetical protein